MGWNDRLYWLTLTGWRTIKSWEQIGVVVLIHTVKLVFTTGSFDNIAQNLSSERAQSAVTALGANLERVQWLSNWDRRKKRYFLRCHFIWQKSKRIPPPPYRDLVQLRQSHLIVVVFCIIGCVVSRVNFPAVAMSTQYVIYPLVTSPLPQNHPVKITQMLNY